MRQSILLFVALVSIGRAVSADTIEMKVHGLVCAFCAQGIEKNLRKNPATADVFVSLEHKLVVVATREGRDIPDADLRKALTDAGYDVKSIERTATSLADIRERLRRTSK